jgi:hypothetical protein
MPSTGRILRLLVVALIALGETAFVFYLIWINHFDLHYYTHVNKLLVVITLWLIVVSNFSYDVFQWTISVLLPFLVATALFVSVAVTIVVLFQPHLIIDDIEEDGIDAIGTIHTGDYLLHQLPLLEAIIVTWCVYKQATMAMRDTIDAKIEETALKVLFIIFACSLHIVVLFIYIMFNDYTEFYLLSELPDARLPTVILTVTAFLVGGLVFWMFYAASHSPKPKAAGKTLLVTNHAERVRIQNRISVKNRLLENVRQFPQSLNDD